MSDPLGNLFKQFLKERIYLKAVTPKTRIWYESSWKAFQASQAAIDEEIPSSLTKARLQAFVVYMRDRGRRPRSVNTYLQALNAFAKWLHEESHAPERVRIKPLKVEKRVLVTLTEPQIRQLLGYKPRAYAEWRVHTLDCLLLDAGLRIEEALGLKVNEVDFDNLLITVDGKGQKQRRIPFSFEMRKRLYRFMKVRETQGIRSELVFASRDDTRWLQRNALRSHYLLLDKAGVQRCGFHRLRHTMATQYLKAGGELVRLSKQLGHTQITTTMAYEHLLTEDLQAPHQKLSILSRLR